MAPEEFKRLRDRFERLTVASERDRAAEIQQLSESEPDLAAELRRMLSAHEESASLLDRTAPHGQGGPTKPAIIEPPRQYQSIGPYHLEKELGRGGMGVVYQATRADGSFEKRVAIKILRRDRIDASFLGRFHQERQILAQLNHPHIAAILDAGETPEGDPYFVMEYVDGVPITRYCWTHSLSVARRLDLFLQLCDAVQHAHRSLTIHRDLKPGNILVTEAGAVKLLDFGIAKLLQPEPGPQSEAVQTAAILTPEYASPEQIQRAPITTSTDVFSLGILLYEMLSGEHPFRRHKRLPHEVMTAICNDDPPPASAVTERDGKLLRGELDSIILTALRKQPAWRYSSVEQLAGDVERYRQGWPVLAKGNGPVYRFQKFARRHWLPLTAGVLIFCFLITGILATAYEARIAGQARAIAEKERERAERQRAEADQQRVLAEQQRLRAEQAQQVAAGQTRLAEQRTREMEVERKKEQDRYHEARALASSLIFDLYDGIRDLAGSTTARKLIVAKARNQLELLSADAGQDIGFQRDLAAAYERMGELRVDPRQPSHTDATAALESYQHAVNLRKKIAARKEAQPRDRRDLALSLSKFGDGEFMASNTKASLATYLDAHALAQSLLLAEPRDPSMRRALGAIDERRCAILLTAGDNAAAIDSCRESIATLSPLVADSPDDIEVQRLLAVNGASYANALRLSGKAKDAVEQAKLALESLQRLERLAPSNAEYRRLSSSVESILANSLAASGDQAASFDASRRSVRAMQIAIEIDPTDLGSPLRLAVTLLAYSRRLAATNNAEAHDAAREALELLESTSGKPGAGPLEMNEYADALLKAGWPDLSKPAKALQLAQTAVSATHRKNAFFLDTLAWAYFKTGDAPKAAETEREALQLLPPTAKGGLHDELDRGLNTFLGGSN